MPFLVLLLVGLVVVAVLAVAAVVSALGFAFPWVLLGLGIWFLCRAAGGCGGRSRTNRWQRRDERAWRRWEKHGGWQRVPEQAPDRGAAPRPTVVRPPAPTPVRSSRPTLAQAPVRTELPLDVQVKVEQIRRKAEVLESYATRFPPFSQDLYLVRQTASDYLPRTVKAYLALPPGSGEHVLTPSGRTALDELREQLALLDAKLDEIADDLQRRDVAHLLANRHFLEERFGGAEAPEPEAEPEARADPETESVAQPRAAAR